MANNVEQKLMFCKRDQKTTLHYRNAKKRNFAFHAFMIIVTCFFWLIPMMFMRSGGKGLWTCSQCGTTRK